MQSCRGDGGKPRARARPDNLVGNELHFKVPVGNESPTSTMMHKAQWGAAMGLVYPDFARCVCDVALKK
jgi:hypothetical protein